MKFVKIAMLVSAMAMVLAAPASAAGDNTGLIVFKGTALVCSDNGGSAPGCGTNGGLQFPGIAPLDTHGNWSFGSGSLNLPSPADAVDGELPTCLASGVFFGNQGVNQPCSIVANGFLAPVAAGIGASCGVSNGNGGTGTITVGSDSLSTKNVGWVTSAGGTLPVQGDYADDSGQFAGIVQAQGGDQCASGTGSSTFRVAGVLVGAETTAPSK